MEGGLSGCGVARVRHYSQRIHVRKKKKIGPVAYVIVVTESRGQRRPREFASGVRETTSHEG